MTLSAILKNTSRNTSEQFIDSILVVLTKKKKKKKEKKRKKKRSIFTGTETYLPGFLFKREK